MAAIIFGALVGLSLGLTGGGGSILAVPLLVYGLGFEFRQAVAVSLAVVGVVALYGAVLHARQRIVVWGAGLMLGLGGIAAAPWGAALGRELSEAVSLSLFAVVMMTVATQMIRSPAVSGEAGFAWARCPAEGASAPRFSLRCAAKLLLAGAIVGILSGIFGVGGGFLIVPALLIVLALPMERALATSLVSIALIAASGFAAHRGDFLGTDLAVVAEFFGGAVAGFTGGALIKSRFRQETLRRIFGVVTFAAALVVLARSL